MNNVVVQGQTDWKDFLSLPSSMPKNEKNKGFGGHVGEGNKRKEANEIFFVKVKPAWPRRPQTI